MRKQWSTAKVVDEAEKIARDLGHFPSVTELKQMGRNDLMCQITRRGGFLKMAEQVGIPRLVSDSDVGWAGEKAVLETLTKLGHKVERSPEVKAPFDLMVNDRVRIDVKSARYAEYGRKPESAGGWHYRIGKRVQADIVVLHQLDTSVDYVFYWWEVTTTNMTIARNGGKYAAASGAYHKIQEFEAAVKLIGKRP